MKDNKENFENMERETERNADGICIELLLRNIVKNAWMGIVAVLVVWLGILGYTHWLYQPEYTAEVVLSVVPRSSNAYESYVTTLGTAGDTAEMFCDIFESDAMRQWICRELENPDFEFEIYCHAEKQTNILCLCATADTKEDAYRVMQVMEPYCHQVSAQLFGESLLEVLRPAQMPTTASNFPDLHYCMFAGMMIAMTFYVGVMTLLFVLPTGKNGGQENTWNAQTRDSAVLVIDVGKIVKKMKEILRKTWIQATAMMVLGACVGLFIQWQCHVPAYSAYCTLGVRVPATLAEGQADADFLAVYDQKLTLQINKSLTYLLTGGVLDDAVREKAGGISPAESIAIENLGQANVFRLSACGENPEAAVKLLEASLAACEESVSATLGPVRMVVMEEIVAPDTPSNIPNPLNALGIGGAIGFCIGVMVFYWLGTKTKAGKRKSTAK